MTGEESMPFAWQGLQVKVPENWELAAASGTQAAGRVRLDDEDGPRLEVEWEKRRRFRVDAALEKTLRRLEAGAKKRGQQLDFRSEMIREGSLVTLRWSGDEAGLAFIGYCPSCRRAARGQVTGADPPDEIIHTLQLCSCKAPHVLWSAYGLQFEIPRGWRLLRTVFRPGLVRLSFRRRAARLTVTRWGAAGILLAGQPLSAWLPLVRKELGLRLCADHPVRHLGHDALRVSCRLLGFRRSALVWHCPQAGRLFAVVCHFGSEDLTRGVGDSVICHREATSRPDSDV